MGRDRKGTPPQREAAGGDVNPAWQWVLTRSARRQLDDLAKEIQERIVADLDILVVDPRAVDA